MMTVGQHDNAWLDVMTKQVPSGVENLRILTNQVGYYNQYLALTKLKELELISEKTYADNMMEYAKVVCGLDQVEYDLVRSKFNMYYGEEST